MAKATRQMKKWMTKFGKEYTQRNALSLGELNKAYKTRYGLTRRALNNLFLGRLCKDIRILEVGSNIGNQLLLLQKMGFKNLYGIEISSYAVEFSKSRVKNINIIQGSVFDIPFKDGYFDLVFTSGVLIHIAPRDIKKALKEIYRCSSRYIWGFEYYSDEYKEVVYRGKKQLLWKADFSKIYTTLFSNLKIEKMQLVRYLENENTDLMFLLKKKDA